MMSNDEDEVDDHHTSTTMATMVRVMAKNSLSLLSCGVLQPSS